MRNRFRRRLTAAAFCPERHGPRWPAFALLAALVLLRPSSALADFSVHMPLVVKGETEVEAAYTHSRDSKASLDNEAVTNFALGYGITSFWLTELEGEWTRPNRGKNELSEIAWENTFQLTEPGEYWLNSGFFAEYAWPQHSGDPPDIKLGPILQRQWNRSLHTVNLFFERQMGPRSESAWEFTYAWQSRFRVATHLDAGFEFFGTAGEVGKPLPREEQELRAGPVLFGEFKPSAGTKLQYQVGYLFGGTEATAAGAWKLNVELEFY